MSFNPRIFFQDPPWIASLFLKGIFTGAEREKSEEYREMEREMRERRLVPNLPHVKALFLGWFEPLRDAIAN